MADDRLFEAMIKIAFREARKGEGHTSPNPIVGAVIFRGEKILATGYHHQVGKPHAEIMALRKAGKNAKGATLAVNLEPCCHYGRTPPCTEAIIKAGIKEVVYSIKDPNLRVCGRGCRKLEQAGIRVVKGIFEQEARRLNEVYITYLNTGRPFVVLKMAQTIDGRIATATGHSQWISCPEALRLAHRLRAQYDAVAVGSGTVREDDPQLTVRLLKGENPLRIIITASPDLSPGLKVFRNNRDNNTIVATDKKTIKAGAYQSAITWPIKKTKGQIDLNNFLDLAGRRGITSILFEGGQRLATTLLKQKLVDKLFLIIAPMIIGRGTETIGDLGIKTVNKALEFNEYGFKKIGTDTLFWGYPKRY